MKRDVEKDLKVNQLNNDGKRRKKQKEQKDGENVALEETMPENQKSLSLLLSRWLHCRQLCH